MCATTLTGNVHARDATAAENSAPHQGRATYFDGKVVEMRYSPGKRDFKIEPWDILAHVMHEKPHDRHPNLYIVAPGTQYALDGDEQYDHNEIISALPIKAEPLEWDVYYAVVLDPALHEDFRSERQLILAAQNEFAPNADFTFDQIPVAAFLRKFLQIGSLKQLQEYRRPDGNLPRLIIVPAKLSVRAGVADPDTPPVSNRNAQTAGSASLPR